MLDRDDLSKASEELKAAQLELDRLQLLIYNGQTDNMSEYDAAEERLAKATGAYNGGRHNVRIMQNRRAATGGDLMITTPKITRIDGGRRGRHYRVEGYPEPFPSVTNVLGIIAKPGPGVVGA